MDDVPQPPAASFGAVSLPVERPRPTAAQLRRKWLPPLLTIVLLLLVWRLSPYRPVVVEGESMLPSLRPGQWIWMVAQARSRPLRRGDVVVVKWRRDTLIKRAVAFSGDQMWCIDTPMATFFTVDPSRVPDRLPGTRAQGWAVRTEPIRRGHVFIIGDNAAHSDDSRRFGPVPEENIIGRILDAPDPPAPRDERFRAPSLQQS
jgi:signal peptidase I